MTLWNKKIIWECRKRVWGWRKNLSKRRWSQAQFTL